MKWVPMKNIFGSYLGHILLHLNTVTTYIVSVRVSEGEVGSNDGRSGGLRAYKPSEFAQETRQWHAAVSVEITRVHEPGRKTNVRLKTGGKP